MLIQPTSKEYVLIPLTGPVADLTVYPVDIAVLAEAQDAPAAGDWQPGQWIAGDAALLLDASAYTSGDYMIWLRLTAGTERPVMKAGRLRIGDTNY